MITSDILCRVFRIRYKNDAGTAFTIEKENVQYIITAKHLFDSTKNGDFVTIEILREKKYYPINVIVMFSKDPNIDCAVLKTNPYHEVTGKFTNENTIEGIVLGQDVFFLGFPYNYDNLLMSFPKSTTPAPFVKKACLSGLSEKNRLLFLDGINNPGFSGGPVCFKDQKTNKYKIAGLINSYRYNISSVFKSDGTSTDLYVRENTGIINACSILEVLSVIENNQPNLPPTLTF